VAKHVLYCDPLRPPIVPDVRGEVFGERRFQRQTTGVHELQHDEGEDRLTQGGCVEDCMRVDKARLPGESNPLTQIAIEPTVTDKCYGDPGHVAGDHEAAQGGVVNAHGEASISTAAAR
jgi:hypothetical protein